MGELRQTVEFDILFVESITKLRKLDNVWHQVCNRRWRGVWMKGFGWCVSEALKGVDQRALSSGAGLVSIISSYGLVYVCVFVSSP